MPTVEARIRTDRAARYLAQLCRHAAGVGVLDQPGRHGDDRPLHAQRRVERDDTDGVISFDRGRCTLRATAEGLILVVEAEDDEALRLMQDALGARVELIGRRDHLIVTWRACPPQAPLQRGLSARQAT
jgi:hypothetical protein